MSLQQKTVRIGMEPILLREEGGPGCGCAIAFTLLGGLFFVMCALLQAPIRWIVYGLALGWKDSLNCPPGLSGWLCGISAETRYVYSGQMFWIQASTIIGGIWLVLMVRDVAIWRQRRGVGGLFDQVRDLRERFKPNPYGQMESRARWRLHYHLEDSRQLDLPTIAEQIGKLAHACDKGGGLTFEYQGVEGKLQMFIEGPRALAGDIEQIIANALPAAKLERGEEAIPLLPGIAFGDDTRAPLLTFARAKLLMEPISALHSGWPMSPAQLQQRFVKRRGPEQETAQRQKLAGYLDDLARWQTNDRRPTRFQPAYSDGRDTDPFGAILTRTKYSILRISYYGPAFDDVGQLWQRVAISVAADDPTPLNALGAILGGGVSLELLPSPYQDEVVLKRINAEGARRQTAAQLKEDVAIARFLYPPDTTLARFNTPEPPQRWCYLPATVGHPEIDLAPTFSLAFPDSYQMPIQQDGGGRRAAGLVLGYADGDLRENPRAVGVGLTNDLYRHMFIKGATGTGKSHLEKLLARQAAALGMSLVVLDPHGQMVRQLFNEFDPATRARTEIIDLDARSASIRLNPLAVQGTNVDQAVDVAMRFFKLQGLSPDAAPRRYAYCQAWLAVLLADAVNRQDPAFGLLEFVGKLNDQPACTAILANFEEAVAAGVRGNLRACPEDLQLNTARFHANEPAPDWAEHAQGIARTISEIVGSPSLSALLRPPFTNPSALLDNGGILLCALNEETGGAAVSKLFEIILLALQQSIMGRGQRFGYDEDRYWPGLILIDEARHVVGDKSLRGAGPLVASMLKDFRKFRVACCIAMQNLEDISSEVYNSITGNTAIKLAYKDIAEAPAVAKMFGPQADPIWPTRLQNKDHQALVSVPAQGDQLLGTIRVAAKMPPMVANLAGTPSYQGSGQARVWLPDSEATQRSG